MCVCVCVCVCVCDGHESPWQTDKGTWLSRIKEAIATLDADESGSLEFPEFLILLAREPWLAIIPAGEAREEFLGKVGQMEVEGQKAALEATRHARSLFEEADEDGSQTIEVAHGHF